MKPAPNHSREPGPRREAGHLILSVMIGLTVMAILLTALVQQWSIVQRREAEKDLIFRGNQYVKAIRQYQAEHGGAFPTRLESLVDPGPRGYRYIRKLFRDPMAPDGKWGILLLDPSGRGFINPNAPTPEEGEGGGIAGLDDIGWSSYSSGSKESSGKGSGSRGKSRSKAPAARSGGWLSPGYGFPLDEEEEKESVTAPGQPVGPIVGVVSLHDDSSYRRYKEKENYTLWAFHVFDLPGQQQQQQKPKVPVPTPGWGVGPGGQQTVFGGGKCSGKDCPPGQQP